MAENGVIGRDNSLPWRLPLDMRHFMTTTMGKPVVMGRKTFESMKAPLPGRANIVMTRDQQWRRNGIASMEGVDVCGNLEAALELAEQHALVNGAAEIMVIGGAEIYRLALPRADRLYVTLVHDQPAGDVYFPKLDWDEWQQISADDFAADERHSAAFTIASYKRAD